MNSYHISGGSVIIGDSLIGMEKGNRLDHQDDDGYDCGVHVFEAKGGLDALRAIRPIKIMNKEYDKETVLRELAADREDAFYMVDLSIVLAKLGKWRNLMPRVKVRLLKRPGDFGIQAYNLTVSSQPFYAIKCNGDELVCRLLANAGCGFDCASQAEIEQVLSCSSPRYSPKCVTGLFLCSNVAQTHCDLCMYMILHSHPCL
jgi:hypothetical protein